MVKIMRSVLVSLLLIVTCFAVENTTTKLEQQLKVQKRAKQYLIEDDPKEGPEQKRDERQSTLIKNSNSLNPKGNSRIINIRLQPNMLTAPIKQVIKPILQKPTLPQIIPTKIPVVLKTTKIVPPAYALRMKMLQNKINESLTNTEKSLCPANDPSPTSKNNIPYFTIEDKINEGRSGSITVEDNNILDSNVTLIKDGKETNINGNSSLNEGNKDQVPVKTDIKATPEVVQKPVSFFVDEPEPLPPSIRKQYLSEVKEITPKKPKEIPIVKHEHKHKKEEFRKKMQEIDESNDPDIVQISNGTHLISIKKLQNNDRHNIDTAVSRNGEQDTAVTEERIVNQAPPIPKPISDEPEKYSMGFRNDEKNMGLAGLVCKDNINKEGKDQDDCITPTRRNYELFEEKPTVSPFITIQQTNPPTTFNEGTQEPTWNYLQNPYYNPYYQNIYDQYRRNYGLAQPTPNMYGLAQTNPNMYGLAQTTPNVYGLLQTTTNMYGLAQTTPNACGLAQTTPNGQETNAPKNFGVQSTPHVCGQRNSDPNTSSAEITLPYYPNGYPPVDLDATQNQYYRKQPEIENTIYQEVHNTDNSLDRILRAWKDLEIKMRNAQMNDVDESLDIDIRREGNKGDNVLNKSVNPYATSSLPISINGALVYPYMNPGYRNMR